MSEPTKETWGSRFGFIMSTMGFSIGLGSVWRFPYKVSVNGGGAFLFVYIIIAAIICVPLFMAELGLGRKTGLDPIRGMRKLTHPGSPWTLIGWMGCLASFMIMSYYFMIMGWTLAYMFKPLLGQFNGVSTHEQALSIFTSFSGNPFEVLIYTAVTISITGFILVRGLRDGIERACSWMLPILFVLIVVLAIRSLTLPGATEGLMWYLTPDFSKITGATVLDAMGQSFFAVGIGVSTAFLYGSYLRKDSNLPADTITVVGGVTLIAFLCGLIIFPALSAFNMPNASGPSLVYETMPLIFNQMPFGNVLATVFFLLCLLAGLTSAFGYVEAVSGTMAGVYGLSRKTSTWGVLFLLFLMNIPSAMSYGAWKDVHIFGRTFFDFFDYLSGSILMPVTALCIALFTVFVWKFENYMLENNVGAGSLVRVTPLWRPFVTFLIPGAVLIIFLAGI